MIDSMNLTPKLAGDFETYIKAGSSLESAAAALNIPPDALAGWLQTDPKFKQRIDAAMANARLLAEISLREKSPSTWLRNRPRLPARTLSRSGQRKIDGLTAMQARFCREYIVDSNATKAAIRAGCSTRSACAVASRWLTVDKISRAIEKHRGRLLARTDITVGRVLRERAAIAYFNPRTMFDEAGALLPINQMPEDAVRAIAGMKFDPISGRLVDIRLNSKNGALDALDRILGLYIPDDARLRRQQIEGVGKDGAATPVEFKPPPSDEEKFAKAVEIIRILREVGGIPERGAIDVTPQTNGKVHE